MTTGLGSLVYHRGFNWVRGLLLAVAGRRRIGKWEQERGDRPLQLRMGPGGTVENQVHRYRLVDQRPD